MNGLLKIEKVRVNSDENGLPHIISVSFFGIEGEAIVASLDLEDICVATGSACSSNDLKPSNSLLSIGLTPQEANSTVRFSLSRLNTKEEIDKVLDILAEIVEKLREISPF